MNQPSPPSMPSSAAPSVPTEPVGSTGEAGREHPRGLLRLRDTVSLIIGIVVGTGIYRVSSDIAQMTGSAWELMGVWLAAGVLSTLGAMCYAELVSADPRSGGDYRYLRRAYGDRVGITYGWVLLSAVLPGNIAAMSYVFAQNVSPLFPGLKEIPCAVLAVAVLGGVNLAGTVMSRRTQNLLTLMKVLGLGLILLAGIMAGARETVPAEVSHPAPRNIALAIIFALFAFGGWNESAYVASEVREPRRNVPRALWLGLGAITLLYLLVNLAYLLGLGMTGLANAELPAGELASRWLGPSAGRLMNVLIGLSALGAMQGMLFTGSRLIAVVGSDHPAWQRLNVRNVQGSPVWAILLLAGLASLALTILGSGLARDAIAGAAHTLFRYRIPWDRAGDPFQTVVIALAPVVWCGFGLAGLSVIVLRLKEGSSRAPVQVPGYPLTPILFSLTCLWMCFRAIQFAWELTLLGLVPMLIGWPFIARRSSSR